MEDLIIYGLTNKKNQRIYGTTHDLIEKGFHKGNLSELE